jgi:AcrR family transcriptional regulator
MTRTVHRPRRRSPVSRPAVVDRRGQIWERILGAAGRLMAERGVAGVSVEQILLEAGVSRGTFYSYCRNKGDLVVALMEPVFDEGALALAGLADRPPADVVPGIANLYLALWRRHRHALLLIPGIDAATFARLRTRHLGFTGAMKAAFERAAAGGQLRNACADYSFRLLSRTAVPLLRVYADHPDGERLFAESLTALLVAP